MLPVPMCFECPLASLVYEAGTIPNYLWQTFLKLAPYIARNPCDGKGIP